MSKGRFYKWNRKLSYAEFDRTPLRIVAQEKNKTELFGSTPLVKKRKKEKKKDQVDRIFFPFFFFYDAALWKQRGKAS